MWKSFSLTQMNQHMTIDVLLFGGDSYDHVFIVLRKVHYFLQLHSDFLMYN